MPMNFLNKMPSMEEIIAAVKAKAMAPIDVAKLAMQHAQADAPLSPDLRQGVPPEALSANIDPNSPDFQRRQALAQALFLQRQGQMQPPPQGQPPQGMPQQ